MEQMEASFKTIIDLLPVYLTIQDRDLKIRFANRTFIKDFGDGTGRHCHTVYQRSSRPCSDCPVRKTFRDSRIHLSEETVRTLDGKQSQMIIYAAPILDQTGAVHNVMELAVNISRVKAIQKELTTVGQSMAYMSHGIKNILEALQGGAYLIDEGLHDEDMKLIRHGWDIVRNNILDISVITQNVLYASKKRALRFEKVHPREILEVACELFHPKTDSCGIRLEYHCNPDLPQVTLDIFSIRRLFNNLISNAIEACRSDTVKDTHAITLKADYHNELQYRFEVEDNGIGMDAETRRQVFDEFFSTRGSAGTGLGLTVVNRIVKEHQGKLEVKSTPGVGSIFRIIFRL